MIGNSKSIATTIKHLPKMYAGLACLEYEELNLLAMVSKENERVAFCEALVIGNGGIDVWLRNVDNCMIKSLQDQINQGMSQSDTYHPCT